MVVMSKRIGFPIPKFTILMAINHQSVWVVYDIAVLTLSGLLTHGLLMSSGIPNYYLRSKTLLIIPSMLSKKSTLVSPTGKHGNGQFITDHAIKK